MLALVLVAVSACDAGQPVSGTLTSPTPVSTPVSAAPTHAARFDPSCEIAEGIAADNLRAGTAKLVTRPNVGRIGTELSVEGVGFPPGMELELRLGRPGTELAVTLGRATSDAQGEFRVALVVPAAPVIEVPPTATDRRCVSVTAFGMDYSAPSGPRLVGAAASLEVLAN